MDTRIPARQMRVVMSSTLALVIDVGNHECIPAAGPTRATPHARVHDDDAGGVGPDRWAMSGNRDARRFPGGPRGPGRPGAGRAARVTLRVAPPDHVRARRRWHSGDGLAVSDARAWPP